MKKVIAIIDIGKTNKKILLFDKNFDVVFRDSTRFEEIKDDDGYPCDNIEFIEKWMKDKIYQIQRTGKFKIKAINFSTHGATLVYLNEYGKKVTPLYNYLKPITTEVFEHIYEQYGNIEEFSRKTASPSYGMLNAGVQILWIKYTKPHYWNAIKHILHYPQYLSYLFTKEITSDYTSIGAHTAIWDFDEMRYHDWLTKEEIRLPKPVNGKKAKIVDINGESIAIGTGLHDSSSSIIPLLEKEGNKEFILLSTGTWIIAMNAFSKTKLTTYQLKNNCLCFMTPEKRQIKSSMQFLGHIHEIIGNSLSDYFSVAKNYYLEMTVNRTLCIDILARGESVFLSDTITTDFKLDLEQLNNFESYELAYYQLIFEITQHVYAAIKIILDKGNNLKDVYISGGFNKNAIFVEYLRLIIPNQKIQIQKGENASALGAAMLMKEYVV